MGAFAVCPLPNQSGLKPSWTVASQSGTFRPERLPLDPDIGLYVLDHSSGDLDCLPEQTLTDWTDEFPIAMAGGYVCGGPGLTLQGLKTHIRSIRTVSDPVHGDGVWPWFDFRYLRGFLTSANPIVRSRAWGPIHWVVYADSEAGLSVLNAKAAALGGHS